MSTSTPATEKTKPKMERTSEGLGAGQDDRGVRRTITGTVTSTKMLKTAVITVIRRVRDRRFHKFVTRRVKYKAHDENNQAKVGDLVEIIEARPMSKTKRWRILRTIKSNVEVPQLPTGGRTDATIEGK
jgi:small subunit ribosomal protein S17